MTTAKQPIPHPHYRWVSYLVTGSMFMEVLDGNIISTALPEMARSFGVEAIALNIAMSAYMLALAVFIPVSGWIADRLGARRVFACAIAGFTLSSMLCGLANDLHTFVLLRILQGASGALMVPVGRLLVLRQTPKENRMAAMANLVWPALVAPVIAPPLGGFIVHHASWHWIFFLNLPLGVIALVLALALIPEMEPEPQRPFDWPGFLLSGIGIFALLTSLEALTSKVTATSGALVAGSLVLVAVAIRHFLRAASPMLDLGSMRIPTFRVTILSGSVTRIGIGALPFLLPLMFQLGFGYDPFRSGLLLLAVFAGNLLMKSVTTPILRRFGYRPVMLWNGLLAALCLAGCAFIGPSTPIALVISLLVANGMTRSMQFTCLGTLAFSDVPDEQMSHANGLSNVVAQLSMAAGVTVGAMAVRFGEALTRAIDIPIAAAPYRVAFCVVAMFALAGLLGTLRLPRGAGDHFVSGKRARPAR